MVALANRLRGAGFRVALKILLFAICLLVVAVAIVLCWVEKKLTRSELIFVSFAQLVALLPGVLGSYLRAAYYFGVLDSCSWETQLGFGSMFTHRGVHVAAKFSSGAYCVIGHARIGAGVRMASRVSIPSGKRQHIDENGQMISGTNFETVSIGSDCWVGEGAIVMADIGANSIVSAGSVVLSEMPQRSIIGGNPAKVLKALESSSKCEKES